MNFNYAYMLEATKLNDSAQQYVSEQQVGALEPYLGGDKGKRILEIGPGVGITLAALVKAGYAQTEGVEGDETLAARNREIGLKVRYVPRDQVMAHLASVAGQFDLIFCMHVIEHIPVDEQLEFVRAVTTALKPGGYFICETPNALGLAALYYRYGDWTHRSLFTVTSLGFLLANAGLDIIYVGGATDGVPPGGNIMSTFIRRGGTRFLRFFSRGLWRFILFSELGPAGLRLPLQAALRAVGRKP